MTARAQAGPSEDGSVLLLTVFYAVLSLVLILGVVAATSLYLERKRLFTIADGAALAGAEAFALDAVRGGSDTPRPTLTSAEVAAAVADYLERAPRSGLERVTVTRAASADGTSAIVGLRAAWRPPVLALLLPDGVPIEVTVSARSVFHG